MKTYKNLSEVAKKYNVSSSTVTMWVKAAKENKNNLLIIEDGSKIRIIDNQHNDAELSKLKEIGEKYRPSTFVKRIKVDPKFFEIFSPSQVSEIITSIETYNEIPHKFTYLNDGAKIWSEYVDRSLDEKLVNTVTNTIELLKSSLPYLIDRLSKDDKVNVIDVGTGDGKTTKDFLNQLIKEQKLLNYIGIDISPQIFKILEKNFIDWFGSKLNYTTKIADINKEGFQDTLFYLINNLKVTNKIKNLVLFLETTLENQREFDKTLINLKESLGKEDSLILMQSLLSKEAKIYFDYWTNDSQESDLSKLPLQTTWIPELLGLNSEYYEPEFIYNELEKSRFIKLRPIHALELDFSNENFKKIVTIDKGQSVIVWRHSHHELKDIISKLNSLGLEINYAISSSDKAQVLLACNIKS